VDDAVCVSFLEGFRDLLWGMRWILAPGCLVSLSLVIANAISISVRERRTELAVLKVLGFRPYQILMLVLGESRDRGSRMKLADAIELAQRAGVIVYFCTYSAQESAWTAKPENAPPLPGYGHEYATSWKLRGRERWHRSWRWH
jgi:hypothetical protein